jgi:putative DNA primase/helicase
MLATLRYPDGTGASVHRTYLTLDGQKAAVNPVRKVMPGFPLEGAAVRLGGVQERLGIAEGIETALCAGKLFLMPVWAGISANGILSWQPPEGVKSVVIFADNDSHFVGQEAAYRKARALHLKGYDVEVQVPPGVDQDWCDVWGQRAPMQGVA